jgi:PBP1b-binding outer membrane lipoprotein LpoB
MKKIILSIAGLSLLGLVLVGCSKDEAPVNGDNKNAAANSKNAADSGKEKPKSEEQITPK